MRGNLRLRGGFDSTSWAKQRESMPTEIKKCILCNKQREKEVEEECREVDEGQSYTVVMKLNQVPNAASLTENKQLS